MELVKIGKSSIINYIQKKIRPLKNLRTGLKKYLAQGTPYPAPNFY